MIISLLLFGGPVETWNRPVTPERSIIACVKIFLKVGRRAGELGWARRVGERLCAYLLVQPNPLSKRGISSFPLLLHCGGASFTATWGKQASHWGHATPTAMRVKGKWAWTLHSIPNLSFIKPDTLTLGWMSTTIQITGIVFSSEKKYSWSFYCLNKYKCLSSSLYQKKWSNLIPLRILLVRLASPLHWLVKGVVQRGTTRKTGCETGGVSRHVASPVICSREAFE